MPLRKQTIRLPVYTLLILFSQVIFAQIFPARFYSTQDGMPSNSVFGITQDNTGVMWFVTSKGIVSYNGQEWETHSSSVRMPHSEHSVIKTADDGSIWAAGQDNKGFVISYFKNGNWNAIGLNEKTADIPYDFAFDISFEGGIYKLWVASQQTIHKYSFESDSWELKSIPYRINTLVHHESGVYLCTDQGLFNMLNDSINEVNVGMNFLNDQVLSLTIKNDKTYLLGFNWLAIISDKTVKSYWENLGMSRRPLTNKYALVIDGRSRIFYNCDSPIQMFNQVKGKGEIIETEDKIQNAKSVSIYEDKENNIWVGDHRGLFRFNQLRFSNYNRKVGLQEDEVTSIIQTSNDQLILANPSSLNFLRDGAITAKLNIPHDTKKVCRVLDMTKDNHGALYLALGPAGLYKYHNNVFSSITFSKNKNLDFTSVKNFNGKIYATSRESGLFEVSGKSLLRKWNKSGIRNIITLDESVIVCTKEGMYKLSEDDTIHYGNTLKDYKNVFSAITWSNQLLAGTSAGLLITKEGRITDERFLDIDLPVYALMEDESKNLWIGTGDGVLKWDGEKLRKYDRSDGLVGSEVNRSALIQDSGGKVWIGTELGASAYSEDEDLTINLAPIVSITKLKDGNGDSVDPLNSTIIPYDLNDIEIHFQGVSFINEEKVSYRYKLEGWDKDWLEIKNNNNTSVRYTNLKSNEYTFVVQSRIDKGSWSTPVKSSFEIGVPFYATWWFILAMALILLVSLLAIYRLRFLYLIRRQEQLMHLIKERTKEISDLNQSLEQKVMERTMELEERNKRLAEYAFINAHLLRAPLTRIQSLTILMEQTKEMESLYIDILKTSTSELDDVIFSINTTLRED